MQPPQVHPAYPAAGSGAQVMMYQQVVSSRNVVSHYPHRQAFVLGIIQLTIGIVSIVFQGLTIALYTISMYGAAGFWAGIFFIIAGSFGIVSAKMKTYGWIIAFMVMSILSAVFTCGIIINSSVSLAFSGYLTSYNGSSRWKENSRLAVDSILVILGLTELVVAIWSSALGCIGTCCRPEPAGGAVQYIGLPSGAQPVMVVNSSTSGQMAAHMTAQQSYPQGCVWMEAVPQVNYGLQGGTDTAAYEGTLMGGKIPNTG